MAYRPHRRGMVDDRAIAVRRGLRWMEREQRRDGSWRGESPLSTIHATTRCLRAFLGAGFPSSYPVVVRAQRWLVRPEAEGSVYHYFWRLGAFSELEGASEDVLDHDFDVVEQTIDRGLVLDRRLNYHAFLFDCAANCGRGSQFQVKADDLNAQLEQGKLDVTPALWGFVGLERSGYPVADLKEPLVELIRRSVNDQNGLYHLNGLVVETSFLVFNVCRSASLSQDPRMRPVVQGASRWILARQRKDGSWPTEPPVYNGDPQCVPYFTGVATRALAEYVRRYLPLKLAEVFVSDWRLHVLLRGAVRWAAVLLFFAAVSVVGALMLPQRWNVLVTLLGVAASVIEIALFTARVRHWMASL
jgi:hypothetical protein